MKKVLYEEIRLHMVGYDNQIIGKECIKNCTIHIKGNNNLISIGKDCLISNSQIYMDGNNHILQLDNNCIFNNSIFYFEDSNCRIRIGSQTTATGVELAVTEPGRKIVVGHDCMFSHPTVVRTGDSHSIIDKNSGLRINQGSDVFINDHVWIGANAIILKGVTIGSNSIIGTNSVVTRSVEPYTLVAGAPAKVIKENISWKRERIYE